MIDDLLLLASHTFLASEQKQHSSSQKQLPLYFLTTRRALSSNNFSNDGSYEY
jgi:hypothetical protein